MLLQEQIKKVTG